MLIALPQLLSIERCQSLRDGHLSSAVRLAANTFVVLSSLAGRRAGGTQKSGGRKGARLTTDPTPTTKEESWCDRSDAQYTSPFSLHVQQLYTAAAVDGWWRPSISFAYGALIARCNNSNNSKHQIDISLKSCDYSSSTFLFHNICCCSSYCCHSSF